MARTFKEKKKKVNAIQWDGTNIDKVREFMTDRGTVTPTMGRSIVVQTKHFTAMINHNEYIVIGNDDKLSAMDEKTFNNTYKPDEEKIK